MKSLFLFYLMRFSLVTLCVLWTKNCTKIITSYLTYIKPYYFCFKITCLVYIFTYMYIDWRRCQCIHSHGGFCHPNHDPTVIINDVIPHDTVIWVTVQTVLRGGCPMGNTLRRVVCRISSMSFLINWTLLVKR